MNSMVRKYYEERLEKITDRKKLYQLEIVSINEEIKTIEEALEEEEKWETITK